MEYCLVDFLQKVAVEFLIFPVTICRDVTESFCGVGEGGGGGGGGEGGGGRDFYYILFCSCVHTLVYLLRDFSLGGGGGGGGGILVSDSISGQDIGICIVCFGLLCSCVSVFVF